MCEGWGERGVGVEVKGGVVGLDGVVVDNSRVEVDLEVAE